MNPFFISPLDESLTFPDAALALEEPNGLLAVGGDLNPERILNAYQQGIFPWFSDDQPILWWSPDPRMVLVPNEITLSRSLRKTIRKSERTNEFICSFDRAFTQVIFSCAQPRPNQPETWITAGMMDAYITLHKMGHAHSFETWHNGKLVGGLYGIAIGRVFFGESMFSTRTDASKIAFAHSVEQLEKWGYQLIDCQVASEHLQSFGAKNITRTDFLNSIKYLTQQKTDESAWEQS